MSQQQQHNRRQQGSRPLKRACDSSSSVLTPPSSPERSSESITVSTPRAKRQRRTATPPMASASTPPNEHREPPAEHQAALKGLRGDPFQQPANGKLYKGQGLPPSDGKLRSYVYRGKKVYVDPSQHQQSDEAEGSDEDALPGAPVQPKLLFPSKDPEPIVNPFAASSTATSSSIAADTDALLRSPPKSPHKPALAFMPPTPQSLVRHSHKKATGSQSPIRKGRRAPAASDAEDSDDDDDDDSSTGPFNAADVFGGETFRPRAKGGAVSEHQHKVRQGQEFARKAGGLFFR